MKRMFEKYRVGREGKHNKGRYTIHNVEVDIQAHTLINVKPTNVDLI